MFHSETFREEQPSTYFVRECREEEITRLEVQERVVTGTMGKTTLERLELDPGAIQYILDVGSGTGGWLIETAKAYPDIASLVGIDICPNIVAYAQNQADEQQVGQRVKFQVMDALRILDFPARSFDLIHQRFGNSYLREWDWPKLLGEYWRVSQQGGLVLIHEAQPILESSSPALTSLFGLASQASVQAGHLPLFSSEQRHITYLTSLLKQAGFQQVEMDVFTLQHREGTLETRLFIEDMRSLFQLIVPFLQKWINMPENYSALYEQMLVEIQEPNFAAQSTILEFRGHKPAA